MQLKKHLLTGSLALCLGGAALAAPMEINGVKVEDSAVVAGAKLPLNGAGTRYKGPFKVYVAELYASKKVSSLD